jgi:O-antigen/teichoic acid export membrane protein
MLVLGAISLFDSLGVMALNQTLLSRCGLHSDVERRRQLAVALAWRFFRWIGSVGFAVGLVVALTVTSVAGDPDPAWFFLPAIVLTYVAGGTAKTSLQSLLVLDRRYAVMSGWLAAEAVLTVLCVVGSLLLWRADALGFLAGYAFAPVVCAAFFIGRVAPGHLRSIRGPIQQDELSQARSYGIPVAAMGPMGWVSTYLDRYILGGALGTAATGVYTAVTGLVARPYALTTAVLTNYFRPLYYQSGETRGGQHTHAQILRKWVLSAMAVGLTGAVALALVGDWIAQIALAPDFRHGAPLLMVLIALGQTFAIMTHAADNAVLAMGSSRRLLQTQALLSIATLVLIPLGVAVGGVVGGALGRAGAEAIKLTAVMLLARSMTRRSIERTTDLVDERRGVAR